MKYKLNLLENGDLGQFIGDSQEAKPIDAVIEILNTFPFNKNVKKEEIEINQINDVNYQVFIGEEEYLLSKDN